MSVINGNVGIGKTTPTFGFEMKNIWTNGPNKINALFHQNYSSGYGSIR